MIRLFSGPLTLLILVGAVLVSRSATLPAQEAASPQAAAASSPDQAPAAESKEPAAPAAAAAAEATAPAEPAKPEPAEPAKPEPAEPAKPEPVAPAAATPAEAPPSAPATPPAPTTPPAEAAKAAGGETPEAKPAEAAPAASAEPKPETDGSGPERVRRRDAEAAAQAAGAAPAAADAAAAKAPPAQRRLRFMFRFQKWSDVLEWFADQAGLSLVLDAPPPGTFNYTDSREYTPEEAIDLLNSVLLTKGYTLIRRDRMLMVVDLSEGVPEGLVPTDSLSTLDKRGKFELVTVRFPLGSRDSEAVITAIKPLLSPYHKLVPVTATREIHLTDRAGLMPEVAKVIESVPEKKSPAPPPQPEPKKPEPPQLQVYRVTRASPETVIEVVKAIIPGAQIVLEPNLNQIHAYVPPSQQAVIAKVIEQMESGLEAGQQRRLEVYPLHLPAGETTGAAASPAAAEMTRRSRYAAQAAAQAAATPGSSNRVLETLQAIVPKAVLSLNQQAGLLIAWATPAEHETIKAAVEKLQHGPSSDSPRQLEVYRVQRANPETLVTTLQSLVPDATLTYDEKTRNLIALAEADDQQLIASTLEKLQGADQPAEEARFQSYPLRGVATATQAAALIGALQPLAPEARLSTDAEYRSLIVWGTPADHDVLRRAIEGLGQGGAAENTPQLEVHRLTKADPTTTQSLLQRLVPHAQLILDPNGKNLIALAAPADQQTIRATLDQLQPAIPAAAEPVLRFHPLSGPPAENLLSVLKEMVPDAEIVSDAKNERLMAVATVAEHESIRKILEEFEANTPPEEPGKLVVYSVTAGQRRRFQTVVDSLTKQLPSLQVLAADDPGELAIWATPSDHLRIAEVLKQLETDPAAGRQTRLAVYPLKSADPDAVLTVLKRLFPDTEFVVDERSRRIMAWAAEGQQEQIQQAIEQIDSGEPGEADQEFAAYPLSGLNATAVIGMLKDQLPDVQFTADATSGTVLAWGRKSDHQIIARTLEKMQSEITLGKATTKSYPLKSITAAEAITVLTTAVPTARLMAGADEYQLVAVASPTDQQMVQAVLSEIDIGEAAERRSQAVVYTIQRADATSGIYILRFLTSAVPNARFTLGALPGQVVAWATPQIHEEIKTLVDQLSGTADPDSQPAAVVYRLEGMDAAAATYAQQFLTGVFPQARFARGLTPDQLVAWASPEDHQKIKSLAEQLTQAEGGGGEPKATVYSLQHIPAATALPLLQKAAPRADVSADAAAPQRLTAWARPDEHAAIAAVLKDIDVAGSPELTSQPVVYPLPGMTTTSSYYVRSFLATAFPKASFTLGAAPEQVVAWATPAEHEQIKKLVDQLAGTGDPNTAPQAAIYTLQFTDASTVLPLLRSAAPQANLTVDATQPRRLTAWGRPTDHETIKRVLGEVDVQLPPEEAPQVAVYPLEFVTAASAAKVLAQALPAAKVTTDAEAPQRLTVFAGPAEQAQVAAVLKEIDVEAGAAAGTTVGVYRLQGNVTAASLPYALRLLTTAFPKAQFSVGMEPGQLLAWANAKDHQGIQELVDRLNAGPPPDEAPQAAVYALKHINATAALGLLTTALPRAKLTPDAGNPQRLTAWASPADQATIQAILEQIDVEGDPGSSFSVAIYTLEGMSTRALYYAGTFLSGVVPQARFTPGSEEGQLVVWATAKDHEQIKQLVEEMTKAPSAETARQIAVYPLRHITAATASQVLTSALPRATFTTAVEDPQRLTALATPADQTSIQAMLEKLDVETDPAGGASVAVYRLHNATTAATLPYALRLLTTAFPKAQFSTGIEPGQLLAWAPAKDQKAIQELVDRLNAGPPEDEAPQASVYALKHINATAAVGVLTSAVPRAKLTSDASEPQRLTAWASPVDQATIQAILEQIDVAGDPESSFSVAIYRLEGMSTRALYYAGTFLSGVVPQARFTPGSEEGQLVVWATAKDHEQIKQLVEEMTKAPSPETARQIAVYPLQHITAATASQVLTSALPRATFTTAAEDPQRLTALASPADQTSIQAMLEKLDVETDPASGATVAAYRLQGATTATVLPYALRLLTSAFPKAQFSAGIEPGQFLAWAGPRDHQGIQQLVERLNAPAPPDEAPLATVYTLKNITAASGLSILSGAVPLANLSPDADDPQRLTAWASPADHATIKAILDQIDVEGDGPSGSAVMVYRLQNSGTPTGMSYTLRLLTSAFPRAQFSLGAEPGQFVAWANARDHQGIQELVDRLNAGPPPEQAPQAVVHTLKNISAASALAILTSAVPQAKLNSDPNDPQRLTSYGTPTEQATIKSVLEQIDVAGDPEAGFSVGIYQLEGMDARGLAYASRFLAGVVPLARFTPGAEAGQMVAWATAKDHQQIARLVEELIKAPPPETAPKVAVYPLEHVTATAASQVLSTAVPKATFTTDPAEPQRLTAWASPADHQTIQAILQEIDAEGAAEQQAAVAVYRLQGMASPTGLTYAIRLLTTAFPRAQFSLGTEPGQFVAWATPKDQQGIQALIERLNAPLPPDQASLAVVYSLQHITAASALQVLSTAVREAQLSVDAANPQRLNAWASPTDQEAIQAILKQIDVEPAPESAAKPVVYHLDGMPRTSITYALTFLRTAVPQARIGMGADPTQLVVFATPKDHETIAELVRQLVEESPERARTAQVYSLKVATAQQAIAAIGTAVPEATLTAGADESQLVVWGRPKDHQTVQEIIDQLEQQSPADSGPRAMVYSLPAANSIDAMRILRTAVPQARLTTGSEPHQLIAWARPADHRIIQEIIDKMGEKGPAELAPKVVVYTFDNGDAATGLAFLQTAVPSARFSAGADPRRLVAWASPAEHEVIKKAVDEMSQGNGRRTTEVYRFRHADATAAFTVLRTLVPAAQMAVDRNEGSLVVSGLPDDHLTIRATIDQMDRADAEGLRPELRVHRINGGNITNTYRALSLLFRQDPLVQLSVDNDNGAVLAIASPAKHERIEQILQSIEEAAELDAETRIELYSLKNIDSTAAMGMLDQLLLKRGSKAEVSYDYASNQLIALARPDDHRVIQETMDQLRGDDPDLEIYELQYVDPMSAQMAISRQFSEDGLKAPQVDTDPVTEQLFVRATAEQHEKIRSLLIKMGETRLNALAGRNNGSMRTIPFRGDLRSALEEIQRVWPALRGNQIHVVSPQAKLPAAPPAQVSPPATTPTAAGAPANGPPAENGAAAPPAEPQPAAEAQIPTEARPAVEAETAETKPADEPAGAAEEPQAQPASEPSNAAAEPEPADKPADEPAAGDAAIEATDDTGDEGEDEAEDEAAAAAKDAAAPTTWQMPRKPATQVWFVSAPAPAEAADPPQSEPEPQPAAAAPAIAADGPQLPPSQPPVAPPPPPEATQAPTQPEAAPSQPAPVPTQPAAVPPQPQTTPLPSEPAQPDPDQPETPRPPIYLVPGDNSLTIVSDDPEALEELERLLRELSGEGPGEVGRNISVFQVRNANAADIADKLREMFASPRTGWQRGSTGVVIVADERLNTILVQGSRIDRDTIEGLIRLLDTNEGLATRPQIVPLRYAEADEVAEVVREVFRSQLSATRTGTTVRTGTAASGRMIPQVAVNRTTNSLVLMAPSPLLDEILQLVDSLDRAAEENPARNVKIIALKKANANRVEQALQRILSTGPTRRSR